MITHTTNFEDLANAPVKQSDVKVARQILDVSGYIDDPTMIWESSSNLMSVKIDSVGEMLGIVTKKAQVKLLGIVDNIISGDTFQVRLGLYDSVALDYEYISEGFYIVDNVDYDYEAGSTIVTLYDHMWKAASQGYAATIPSNAITYPISIADFATYVAGVLNLSVSDMTDLPNKDYMIAEDLYSTQSGTTVQGAIQDIAGATGTTARISDTTLTFSPYTLTTENLDSDHLKTLKIGDTYGPVTSVILGRAPQNDNVAVYAVTPTETVFIGVDTSTDIITITGHGMITGNMVYITSTGTMPAPLVADTPYYVNVIDDDTFKLASTYLDAIAGTSLINLTSAGTGTIEISPIVTQEIQINNDEILDDDRQTLLPPLYNFLAGIDWTDVKADTVGLGWHEVGDVIQFTQGSVTVKAFLSEVHLTLAGSVQENLVSQIPDIVSVNYQQAGGVIKTLYDTQIQVDKQNQDITSLVSEQSTFEGQTTTNFSEIYQNLTDIILTVQNTGGGNLIQNSVGFATLDAQDVNLYHYQALTFWDYPSGYAQIVDGTLTSYSSAESQNAGGVSGQVIEMVGLDVSIEQKLFVASGVPMSFGMRVSNQLGTGGGKIFLYNDIDSYEFDLDQLVNYDWEEISIQNITSTMPWIKVKIQSDSAQSFRFTDARLLYGTTLTSWVQSAQEILSTNVQFTKNGMKIFDNEHNTETQVTYNEFSTRRKSDGAVLFEADDEGIVANDFIIKGSTSYTGPGQTTYIKQVTVPSGSALGGISFIRVG